MWNPDTPVYAALCTASIPVSRQSSLAGLQPALGRLLLFAVLKTPFVSGEHGNNPAVLQVHVRCGAAETDLCGAEELRTATFVLEDGWSASKWVDWTGGLMCELSYHGKPGQPLQGFSLQLTNIPSYTPCGVTEISLTFLGFSTAMPEYYKAFSVSKHVAPLEIASLTADRHAVAAGGEAVLHWRVSGADRGRITPGDFHILEGGNEYRRRLDKAENFRLDIENETGRAGMEVPVCLMPPAIKTFALDREKSRITWETAYATAIRYGGTSCEACGESPLGTGQERARLALEGYRFSLERSLYFPARPQIQLVELTATRCSTYSLLDLQWKTSGLNAITVFLGDPDRVETQSVRSKEASGSRQFALRSLPSPMSMLCVCADGTSFTLTLTPPSLSDGECGEKHKGGRSWTAVQETSA